MEQALQAWAGIAGSSSRPPLPRTRYTSGQCWFEIGGHLSIVDHSTVGLHGFTVECGPDTTLHAYGTSGGAAGAVLNLTGDWPGTSEGPFVHQQQIECPKKVVATDGLIITSTTSAMGSRGPLPYDGGRSAVDEMLPVAFVAWTPSPAYLRPPVMGDGPIARFFRESPVRIDALDLSKLPSVIDIDSLPVDWAGWGKGKPTFARSEALFARFCGEVVSGWHTDEYTPDWQNVGYGREQAATASIALCLLASTAPVAQKATLARNMAQRGFDLIGPYASLPGNRMTLAQCNGGHGNGRKALIVLLGHLLGLDVITYVSRTLGGPSFAEDFQYVVGSRFDGGSTRWRYNSTGDASEDWSKQPEQWSTAWAWQINGYFQHCVGSQIGTALFMRLAGLVDAMSREMDRVVGWYMSKPKDWLRGPNCRVEWGEDYSTRDGKDFCAAAWRKHANG